MRYKKRERICRYETVRYNYIPKRVIHEGYSSNSYKSKVLAEVKLRQIACKYDW